MRHRRSLLCSLSGQSSIVLAVQWSQCAADMTSGSDALKDLLHHQHLAHTEPLGGQVTTGSRMTVTRVSQGVGGKQTYRDFDNLPVT